jgi:hypothetical protein
MSFTRLAAGWLCRLLALGKPASNLSHNDRSIIDRSVRMYYYFTYNTLLNQTKKHAYEAGVQNSRRGRSRLWGGGVSVMEYTVPLSIHVESIPNFFLTSTAVRTLPNHASPPTQPPSPLGLDESSRLCDRRRTHCLEGLPLHNLCMLNNILVYHNISGDLYTI